MFNNLRCNSLYRIAAGISVFVFLATANNPVNAGRIGGAGTSQDIVEARAIDTCKIRFSGQEKAQISARACHLDDIDLKVYDEDGNLVASDLDNDGIPVCDWTPRRTGTFTVKVVNNENSAIDYKLATN